MVNCDHVGQDDSVVHFYPTLRFFVIWVPDADVIVNDILHNAFVRFLDILRALPLRLIHLQVSDILAVQYAVGLVLADESEVLVVSHHPILELFLVRCSHDD